MTTRLRAARFRAAAPRGDSNTTLRWTGRATVAPECALGCATQRHCAAAVRKLARTSWPPSPPARDGDRPNDLLEGGRHDHRPQGDVAPRGGLHRERRPGVIRVIASGRPVELAGRGQHPVLGLHGPNELPAPAGLFLVPVPQSLAFALRLWLTGRCVARIARVWHVPASPQTRDEVRTRAPSHKETYDRGTFALLADLRRRSWLRS